MHYVLICKYDGVIMYPHDSIKKDLVHIRNAIRILRASRNQFASETRIAEPKYWRKRLYAIRDLAECHNLRTLQLEADELILQTEELER
ncbi:hypothetical protein DN523_04065 [Burkholderia multivorans]|nr:hypothetical protein WM33_12520 [Burkholderia multivorans]EJO52512.1 hypothetical protein BURMUCF2_3293 [Burkholderia multivorans CF2]KVZ77420.1 hypothetical protein WL23_21220 [Burkholderia multivorans]MDR9227844.1 hypothetical protein [Burkholderia multivorans]OXH92614.1 hypothetical protein CA831_01985 [Burkholderia multivorans]